jgi:hypothetical protein
MTEVGIIIAALHPFMEVCLGAGVMITEIICGKDIVGTINGHPIVNFNVTGKAGKETGIGKSKTHGECRNCLPDMMHDKEER